MGDSGAGIGSRGGRSTVATALMWAVGAALVLLVAPALRARVPLSDELDLGSLVMPWWTLAQVALLAVLLRLLAGPSRGWPQRVRVLVAVGLAGLVLLASPTVVSFIWSVANDDISRLSRDQVQLALLWSVPLLFYVAPATIVVVMWLRDARVGIGRSVGAAFLALALGNLAAILWFTRLWDRYVRVGG